jgi:hypothetical protein
MRCSATTNRETPLPSTGCVLGDAAVCGLQGPFEGRYGISVRDFGEVHDAPVFRTRVDWYVGFAVCNRKAAARLFNVAPMPLVLP